MMEGDYFVHSIFPQSDKQKNLASKVASLLFSSLLFLTGTSQVALNISNLIKLSKKKKKKKKKTIASNI